jgi:tRNA A37 N6-isopentenylltransferase MiaA
VSKKVLKEYLSVRVDDMLDSGMFEELTEFFDSDELLRNDDRVGLRKAIGERSFKKRGLEALKKEGERSLWEWEEWVRDGK